MDFKGSSKTVVDFQEKRVKMNQIVSPEYLEEYQKRITEIIFIRQEAGVLHNSFEWGYQVYECLKHNNMDEVSDLIQSRGVWHHGVLAEDDVRSSKNLAICLYAFIVQFAIQEQIMDNEMAYSMSDACIQLLENAGSKEEVERCIYASLFTLANIMQSHRKKDDHYLVKQAKDYIYKHFHDEILVSDIAEALNVNASYLERVFKKAQGTTLKRHILKEKVYRAQNLLKYSDFSIAEISRYLCFSSQSHFTKVFRSIIGITPSFYRNQNSEMYKYYI